MEDTNPQELEKNRKWNQQGVIPAVLRKGLRFSK